MLLPLEDRFAQVEALPPEVTGIVLLGGAQQPALAHARGVPALNEFAERITTFLALARRHPEARLVFTGGSADLFGTVMTEADVTRDLLETLGLPPERVLWESRSRNTRENATLTLEAARPRPGEAWLLVTSAMHMPRAVGAFRAAGWPPVIAFPSDYLTRPHPSLIDFDPAGGLVMTARATREWIGLLAYRLLGWSVALFPGPQDATAPAVTRSAGEGAPGVTDTGQETN
jgi:uncharacterized SAM-binding protein YcdF (DUF218 family)